MTGDAQAQPIDGIAFTGQGAQYVGMGRELIARWPEAKAVIAQADALLGAPLSRVMAEGPEETLTLTANAQPAILALGLAHLEVSRGLLPQAHPPRVVLGHSLGEYGAWVAAGALSMGDALRLVRVRGELMQAAVPVGVGAMSAIISAPLDDVEALCAEVAAATGETVGVAVINCPGNTVISGHTGAVRAVEARVEAERLGVVRPLSVSAPFHSPLLAPAAEGLREALERVTVATNTLTVIPNVTAEPMAPGVSPTEIRALLVEQVVAPVRWEASLRAALELGVNRALLMGPGTLVRAHLKRIKRRMPTVAFDQIDELDALA